MPTSGSEAITSPDCTQMVVTSMVALASVSPLATTVPVACVVLVTDPDAPTVGTPGSAIWLVASPVLSTVSGAAPIGGTLVAPAAPPASNATALAASAAAARRRTRIGRRALDTGPPRDFV